LDVAPRDVGAHAVLTIGIDSRQRIVVDVAIEVFLILGADGVGLEESPVGRAVNTSLVVICG
jgi:hypothetical protein